MTGIEALAGAIVVKYMFGFLGFMIVFLIIATFFGRIILGTKSERYRKMITDLYVVGKIRLLAGKDGIDLKEEIKELAKDIKEFRRYNQSLDKTIEQELQEKIVGEGQESQKKSTKK